MLYIVDANNVAGKLKILGNDKFDKQLIDIIQNYNRLKKSDICLVFDGQDSLGDKIAIDKKLTVVYSPRDKYFQSADDKICELVERRLNDNDFKDQITIITEDNELIRRLEKIFEQYKKEMLLIRSSEYIMKIKKSSKESDDYSDELPADETDRITEELKNIW